MNEEQKESDIGGDSDGDVDLDSLDLVGGEHPGGHGDLAAVDCPKHSEEEQGKDDIDADLNTKPELVVQLHDGLNDVELDEDVADNHGDGAADGEEDGQSVEETAEYGSSSCRGQES